MLLCRADKRVGRLRASLLSSKWACILGSKRVGIPLERQSSRRRSLQVYYRDTHRSIGFQPVFCLCLLVIRECPEVRFWARLRSLKAYPTLPPCERCVYGKFASSTGSSGNLQSTFGSLHVNCKTRPGPPTRALQFYSLMAFRSSCRSP
jgi:hypothetical protein